MGGLALPHLLPLQAAAREQPSQASAKSVIVLFIGGGLPQHETWDPKPDAPAEVRGEFGAIATRTPGLFIGELMPKTAQLTDRIAVIRSMVTGDNAHSTSGYQMLTGMPHAPLNRENARPGKPNDWPSLGAIVQALRPGAGGLPASISLPRRMANNNGQDPWPGTDAGFLGRRYDPWLLECDPAAPDFAVPGTALPDGMSDLRFAERRSLLEQCNRHADAIERSAACRQLDLYKQKAVELLTGGQAGTRLICVRSLTPCATVTAESRLAKACSWRGGWWKQAFLSSRFNGRAETRSCPTAAAGTRMKNTARA